MRCAPNTSGRTANMATQKDDRTEETKPSRRRLQARRRRRGKRHARRRLAPRKNAVQKNALRARGKEPGRRDTQRSIAQGSEQARAVNRAICRACRTPRARIRRAWTNCSRKETRSKPKSWRASKTLPMPIKARSGLAKCRKTTSRTNTWTKINKPGKLFRFAGTQLGEPTSRETILGATFVRLLLRGRRQADRCAARRLRRWRSGVPAG